MSDEREEATAEMAKTWAGITMLQEIHMAEMRAIIGDAMLAEDRPTRAAMAKELGLTVYRLRCFMDGADLREQEWDGVATWCAGKPSPHVSPYLVALGVLCHWYPARSVARARAKVWAFVRELMENDGIRLPRSMSDDVDIPGPLRPLKRRVHDTAR